MPQKSLKTILNCIINNMKYWIFFFLTVMHSEDFKFFFTQKGNNPNYLRIVGCVKDAAYLREKSTWTEWSITRSAGQIGLMVNGFPPNWFTASLMAAKSTRAGTPVKSCNITLEGLNDTSIVSSLFWWSSQLYIFSTSSFVTWNPSQFRTPDSSKTRIEKGSLSRLKIYKHHGNWILN